MLIRRFQAWRISPERAGEFSRHHARKSGPFLTVRPLQREWTCGDVDNLHLCAFAKERRKTFPESRTPSRPAARVGIACSPYREGALRCISKAGNPAPLYFTTLDPRKHVGHPPCSLAPHRLRAYGYAAIPF